MPRVYLGQAFILSLITASFFCFYFPASADTYLIGGNIDEPTEVIDVQQYGHSIIMYGPEIWDGKYWHEITPGKLDHIEILVSYQGDLNDYFYILLKHGQEGAKDCTTDIRTYADWGITHELSLVRIDGFRGKECVIHTDSIPYWYFTGPPSINRYVGRVGSDAEVPFYYIRAYGTPIEETKCCSSIVFIPGIKGSTLERINTFGYRDRLWPPSLNPSGFSNDVAQLSLHPDGTSVNDVRVGGLMESFYGVSIYDEFARFADSLVENEISEWRAFPYDWRLAIEDTIENGVKNADGSTTNWVAAVEEIASSSKTGKVAIVAHSMGGLLGKALIKELENQGKAHLVESFVMVGTPQLGTPQAIASMLHGDDEGIPGSYATTLGLDFIVPATGARKLSLNMPGAYNLLPSERYFFEVSDPVTTFSSASFTESWRSCWGDTLDSYSEMSQFLSGQCAPRTSPDNILRLPEVLQHPMLSRARDIHRLLDEYVMPENIRVVQVAGWGLPTAKAVHYRTRHFLPSYEVEVNIEGDKTVLYPSTLNSLGASFYFDVHRYNQSHNTNFQHRNLLNAPPVLSVLEKVLNQSEIDVVNGISAELPEVNIVDDRLKLSTHSPVLLAAYDQFGNFTGIDPNHDLSNSIALPKEDIPGSTFMVVGDSQHIFLPKHGNYRFVYKGTGIGSTTVEIATMSGNQTSSIATYTDLPTTANTEAVIDIEADNPAETVIFLDIEGNGSSLIIQPDGELGGEPASPSLAELLESLRSYIESSTATTKVKSQLHKRLNKLEDKLHKKMSKNAQRIERIDIKMNKLTEKGKISEVDSAYVEELLTALEDGDLLSVDKELLHKLRVAIEKLPIKTNQKNNFYKRLDQIERKDGLLKTLANYTAMVEKRGESGRLTESEADDLINLINQIENVI